MIQDINFGTWYSLKMPDSNLSLTVIPFDGEEIGILGRSHGFVNYITLDNGALDKGFCGELYFKENATPIKENEISNALFDLRELCIENLAYQKINLPRNANDFIKEICVLFGWDFKKLESNTKEKINEIKKFCDSDY